MEIGKTYHQNVEITIEPNGQFCAIVDDIQIRKDTLAEARGAIDRARKSAGAKKPKIAVRVLLLLNPNRWDRQGGIPKIVSATMTGLNRRSGDEFTFDITLPEKADIEWVVPDTPAAHAVLEEMVRLREATKAARETIDRLNVTSPASRRIEIDQYPGVLEQLLEGCRTAYRAAGGELK